MGERLTFPRSRRLHLDRDFRRILKHGRRVEDSRLILYVYENQLNFNRMGLRAGRRLGSAPQRNRMKRLLREAFRLDQHVRPGGLDLVCVLKADAQPTREGYRQSLARLLRRAVSRRSDEG